MYAFFSPSNSISRPHVTLLPLPIQDMVSTRRAFDQYVEMDNTFAATREYKFLVALADSLDARDQEALWVSPLAMSTSTF
jgi:Soluble NSF attachment protein, SNAP